LVTEGRYIVEPLAVYHDRSRFISGSADLDRYFRQQVGQDVRNNVARCFVLCFTPGGDPLGYYTLSSYGVQPQELPSDIVRRLPRYPLIPTILLGRLAVDARYQGQGLGRRLLFSALARALTFSKEIAAYAVIVDAKDGDARRFYERYDFRAFSEQSRRLYLPMRLIEQSGLRLADGTP
jgi:GNAT superfamily N-acetyltransferase